MFKELSKAFQTATIGIVNGYPLKTQLCQDAVCDKFILKTAQKPVSKVLHTEH